MPNVVHLKKGSSAEDARQAFLKKTRAHDYAIQDPFLKPYLDLLLPCGDTNTMSEENSQNLSSADLIGYFISMNAPPSYTVKTRIDRVPSWRLKV